MSEREGSQRSRGARRAGRLAAPREGAGMGRAPAGLSEERTLSEREGSQRSRGARRAGRLALAPAGLSEERTR
jgi:hypothetical protein